MSGAKVLRFMKVEEFNLNLRSARKYIRVWLTMAKMSFAEQSSSRLNAATLFLGKIIRLGFVFFFLIALFSHTQSLAGFSLTETLLFFMTFNLVDMTSQLLFRGIYWIKWLIDRGELDLTLTRPISPLFRLATHTTDFLDLLTLIPTLVILLGVMARLDTQISFWQLFLYLLLVLLGVILALSIHIFVAGVAVFTQEVDNLIWIYRDLMTMGRFPASIYALPVRLVLTFAIPIAVMVSFPAEALLGILSWYWVLFSILWTALFFWGSLKFWKLSLKYYTSVSS